MKGILKQVMLFAFLLSFNAFNMSAQVLDNSDNRNDAYKEALRDAYRDAIHQMLTQQTVDFINQTLKENQVHYDVGEMITEYCDISIENNNLVIHTDQKLRNGEGQKNEFYIPLSNFFISKHIFNSNGDELLKIECLSGNCIVDKFLTSSSNIRETYIFFKPNQKEDIEDELINAFNHLKDLVKAQNEHDPFFKDTTKVIIVDHPKLPTLTKKIALVIGNKNYPLNLNGMELNNTNNDAEKLAQALIAKHFDVVMDTDLTKDKFLKKLRAFSDEAKNGRYQFAMIFYTGHAYAPDDEPGKTYIIPVNTDITPDHKNFTNRIDLDTITKYLYATNCSKSAFVMDACRSPMETVKKGGPPNQIQEILSKGCIVQENNHDCYVFYSTQPLKNAYDGLKGSSSPFCSSFLEALNQQESFFKFLTMITSSTRDKTKKWKDEGWNIEVQVPRASLTTEELSDDFYLW